MSRLPCESVHSTLGHTLEPHLNTHLNESIFTSFDTIGLKIHKIEVDGKKAEVFLFLRFSADNEAKLLCTWTVYSRRKA